MFEKLARRPKGRLAFLIFCFFDFFGFAISVREFFLINSSAGIFRFLLLGEA